MLTAEPIRIDLDQPTLAGFRRFISAWFFRVGALCIVVDPGPLSTIPHLLAELRRHGVERLDAILLTHIHIDHAGGTGALLAAFREARVLCHPDGIRHLVDPTQLWEGSRKVLGPLADAYGEIVPVPAERIGFSETIGPGRVLRTPGHAVHHLSFQFGELLFGGEVAGVRCDVPEGIFMRPATPPRFILEVARDSLERMIVLAPSRLVFAHHGLVGNAVAHLRIARSQLELWVRGVAITAPLPEDDREEALIDWLMTHDEHYRNVTQLPDDIRARERYFLGNTLRGMSEYVASLSPEERETLAAG